MFPQDNCIIVHKCRYFVCLLVCVLYRVKAQGKLLHEIFKLKQWLATAAPKRKLKFVDNRVRLMTMHSSKGLEFLFVAVTGTQSPPLPKCDEVAEVKLL